MVSELVLQNRPKARRDHSTLNADVRQWNIFYLDVLGTQLVNTMFIYKQNINKFPIESFYFWYMVFVCLNNTDWFIFITDRLLYY